MKSWVRIMWYLLPCFHLANAVPMCSHRVQQWSCLPSEVLPSRGNTDMQAIKWWEGKYYHMESRKHERNTKQGDLPPNLRSGEAFSRKLLPTHKKSRNLSRKRGLVSHRNRFVQRHSREWVRPWWARRTARWWPGCDMQGVGWKWEFIWQF